MGRTGGVLGVILALALPWLTGCVAPPAGIRPVEDFQVARFLGNWYEIAYLNSADAVVDESITYTLSRRYDGKLRVMRLGWDTRTRSWKREEYRAWLVNGENRGHLRLSDDGPFYWPWVVFELDDHYEQAWIAGYDNRTLRLLSRTARVNDRLLIEFAARARALGFDTKALVFVRHPPL